MSDLSPILAEVERMYTEVCNRYSLDWAQRERPVITLASKGRKRALVGWYNEAVWNTDTEDVLLALSGIKPGEEGYVAPVKRAEIVLPTEMLGDPIQTIAELARQAKVHQLTLEAGNINGMDSSIVGANQYYPEPWVYRMGKMDCHAFVLADQPSRGWAGLKPNPEFADWVKATMDFSPFDKSRLDQGQRKPVGSRMKKWRCGCTTVRCAVELVATCEQCGGDFTWAEQNEPPPLGYRVPPEVVPTEEGLVAAMHNLQGVRIGGPNGVPVEEYGGDPNRGWRTTSG